MKLLLEVFRWLGTITGYPFKWLFFKTKVYYENENLSRRIKGGALVISNHFNPFDYVQNALLLFPRKLFVVASEDAFRNRFQTFGMRFFGGIQANRVTKSMRFVIESVKEIKRGHLVQIFPEGHNTDDGTIKPFYPSYILIALKSNCLIYPIITDGNYGIFKRVHIMFGEPIDLSQYTTAKKPTKEDILRLDAIVYQKVLALREELDLRIKNGEKRGKKQ